MTIQEEIISLIGKLDYTWYTSVNDLFAAEEGYDHHTKKVTRIVPDYYTQYDQETGSAEPYNWNVTCGIEEYAWEYSCIDYPWLDEGNENDDAILPSKDNGLPVQGHIISSQILKIISDYVNESQEVIKQDVFITKVLTILNGKVKEIEKTYGDSDYSTVARYFYQSLRAVVSGEYRHIRRNAIKQRDFQTFLDFDISLDGQDDGQDTNYGLDVQRIRDILRPLSGMWLGTVIMKKGDFDILVSNTIQFIENKGNCENNIKPFLTNSISEYFISYTFNLLYREKMNGKKIKQAKWATFLKKSFDVFSNVGEETIRKKFKVKPKNYDNDLKYTITYQQSPKSPKVT